MNSRTLPHPDCFRIKEFEGCIYRHAGKDGLGREGALAMEVCVWRWGGGRGYTMLSELEFPRPRVERGLPGSSNRWCRHDDENSILVLAVVGVIFRLGR